FKSPFFPHVCLESTVITFGLPYPDNVRLAKDMESKIREGGSIPLTLGIRDGKIVIGFSEDDFEFFGKGEGVIKANMRDIPHLLAQKRSGALTVSGSISIMSLFNLMFFVTGGTGGVHRGMPDVFDISADLIALSKYKVVVVSSGFKSILDIEKTWEFLETLGIGVVGFKTKKLPGFYFRETDIPLDMYVDSIEELVDFIRVWDKVSNTALLVVNPIPEEDELDRKYFEELMDEILLDVDKKRIKGKDVTPFILSELHSRSGGKTLKSNISLLLNNAKLGGKLAFLYFRKD
ncbi:MAG TPA: pseudouridine-5'-phosphate glycosidase, partial [Firmicutes bacterium]|nr:pseudouridine-5'-phosphate glycosidase [Bacillota bacterium]